MSNKPIPIEPYIEKLVQAILIGATYELAAQFAGISYKTFQRWRQRAEHAADGTPLAHLRQRLSEAEGRAAIGWLAKIEKVASEGDWKAAAWKLERRYPEAYGRTFQKVALTTPDGEASWQPTQAPAPSETFFADLVTLIQTLGPHHANGHATASDAATLD